ncbi:hypothetical protein [Rufibacter roseus]|uniref:Uncharacterized protein n=1 Tax=Rufibacter roseus TaxID=1567108 RepID=A0ABW2DSC3_9BACT|nr:hypothetical protein [Rufibacter roseus]
MEIGSIKNWLEKKGTYKEGVQLYEHLGSNQALKDLFRKGEMAFTRDRLFKALEQLLQENSAIAKPAPVVGTFSENSPKAEKNQKQPHPEENGRLRPLLDERTMLHAQLERMGPKECEAACLRILALTKQISAIYFKQEKPVEPPTDFTGMSEAKLIKELTNMRCLRAKLKKNPKRQAELPALQEKINTVSQLLQQTQND